MNGPNDLDDGWAELARELGLEGDRPFPAPIPDHTPADLNPPEDPPPPADEQEFVEDEPAVVEVFADVEPEPDADVDDAEAGDEGEEFEGDGESVPGEPGEPKKKRRRRRRRKKKGDGTPAVAGEPAAPGEEVVEEDAEVVVEAEDVGPPADGLVEEEGATPAATRELIANWDVPSWETIVNTMLFRPQGR